MVRNNPVFHQHRKQVELGGGEMDYVTCLALTVGKLTLFSKQMAVMRTTAANPGSPRRQTSPSIFWAAVALSTC